MEPKKTPHLAVGAREAVAPSKKVQAESFVSEVKAEIKKITWPTVEELRVYTKIVVGATFFFGVGIYVVDLLIQTTLRVLEFGVQLFGG